MSGVRSVHCGAAVYRHVWPACLRLACDADSVSRQLFLTLVLQATHYFTCNRNYENPDTSTLLHAILVGAARRTGGCCTPYCWVLHAILVCAARPTGVCCTPYWCVLHAVLVCAARRTGVCCTPYWWVLHAVLVGAARRTGSCLHHQCITACIARHYAQWCTACRCVQLCPLQRPWFVAGLQSLSLEGFSGQCCQIRPKGAAPIPCLNFVDLI